MQMNWNWIPSGVIIMMASLRTHRAREKIENLTPWDEGLVEMHEVLSVLDKLMESEDKE